MVTIDVSKTGSTDVSKLPGIECNPYEGPGDLYLRKTEGVQRSVGEAADWGLRLQRAVAEAGAEREGWELEELDTIDSPHGRVWARCNFDFRDRKSSDLIEVKTAGMRQIQYWGDGEDAIPSHYLCQVTFQMWAIGARRTRMPVLLGGQELRIYTIHYDAELAELLVAAGERFERDHVLPRIPPPNLERADAFADYLRMRWPRDTAGLRPATPEERDLVRLLAERKAALKALEEDTTELEGRVKAAIANGAGLEIDGKPLVTYKASKDSERTDWEAVATELRTMLELRGESVAEVLTKHTSKKPGARRLLLKGAA